MAETTIDQTENGEDAVEAVAAAERVPLGELTVQPPEGAEFVWGEVKTNRGTESLGQVPILRWTSVTAAVQFYGEEPALNALNDTGLKVPFQSIARRGRASGKLDANGIAQEQIDYRPGSRAAAASTPASRAKSAAAKAAETLGENGADVLTTLLARIQRGEISADQLAQLAGNQ